MLPPACPVCRDAGFVYPRAGNGAVDYSRVEACRCKGASATSCAPSSPHHQPVLGILQALTMDRQHTAGFICGGVFRKKLSMKNKLQSPPGWTLDHEFRIGGEVVKWNELDRFGIASIEIVVAEHPGDILTARLAEFKTKGLDVDKGTGRHRALADPFWRTIPFYELG